ncbi:MAG: hypothetical protein GXO79_13020 [Chlorobi bacterium]|nr:hypothetical protein [Chlorobiota bacterium]
MAFFKKKTILLFSFLLFVVSFVFSQNYFRFEADYSIKEKSTVDDPMLNMGRLYFDLHNRSIVYDITFPEHEIIVMNDTAIYKIRNNQVTEVITAPNFIDFSIFSLILNGQLSYFGLKNTIYKLTNVEKDNGMVITTWEPPEKFKDIKGKMLLSQIDKKLNGLISFDNEDNIISKQFFKDYQVINGLEIPTTITQFLYTGMDEKIKLTTYKNIKINNMQNEEYYNYSIPDY